MIDIEKLKDIIQSYCAACDTESNEYNEGFQACGMMVLKEIEKLSKEEKVNVNLEIAAAYKAGAEWQKQQKRKIWNTTRRIVPEDNGQILSFDDTGFFYLGKRPHPESVEWCYVRSLLP